MKTPRTAIQALNDKYKQEAEARWRRHKRRMWWSRNGGNVMGFGLMWMLLILLWVTALASGVTK